MDPKEPMSKCNLNCLQAALSNTSSIYVLLAVSSDTLFASLGFRIFGCVVVCLLFGVRSGERCCLLSVCLTYIDYILYLTWRRREN
jgi:hypothetical protein